MGEAREVSLHAPFITSDGDMGCGTFGAQPPLRAVNIRPATLLTRLAVTPTRIFWHLLVASISPIPPCRRLPSTPWTLVRAMEVGGQRRPRYFLLGACLCSAGSGVVCGRREGGSISRHPGFELLMSGTIARSGQRSRLARRFAGRMRRPIFSSPTSL